MFPDIVVIREGSAYRLLHGHLRLATELSLHTEVMVNVPGEGAVKVTRSSHGYLAGKEGERLPVLPH